MISRGELITVVQKDTSTVSSSLSNASASLSATQFTVLHAIQWLPVIKQ